VTSAPPGAIYTPLGTGPFSAGAANTRVIGSSSADVTVEAIARRVAADRDLIMDLLFLLRTSRGDAIIPRMRYRPSPPSALSEGGSGRPKSLSNGCPVRA
jgi:hypothetical protein